MDRPGQRLHRCGGAAAEPACRRVVDRRPRLRCGLVPGSVESQGHTRLNPRLEVPWQTHPPRQAPQPHRDHIRPPRGLAPHRNLLRPMPQGRPPSNRPRRNRDLLAMSPGHSVARHRRSPEQPCGVPGRVVADADEVGAGRACSCTDRTLPRPAGNAESAAVRHGASSRGGAKLRAVCPGTETGDPTRYVNQIVNRGSDPHTDGWMKASIKKNGLSWLGR